MTSELRTKRLPGGRASGLQQELSGAGEPAVGGGAEPLEGGVCDEGRQLPDGREAGLQDEAAGWSQDLK